MECLKLKSFDDLLERIHEANSIAILAKDILDNAEIGTFLISLSDTASRRATANAMTKSALVLLCGYFEGYLKKVIVEFVDTLNDHKLPINSMSDSILYCLFEDSIQKSKGETVESILKLKECIANSNHHPFSGKAIGTTKGNPTVDMVESIFSKIGIKDVIDKLSIRDFSIESTYIKSSQLDKNFLRKLNAALDGDLQTSENIIAIIEKKWEPKNKRRAVGYVGVIEELLKIRNRIAHGENYGEQVTPDELTTHAENIKKLCSGIHELIINELQMYIALDPSIIATPKNNELIEITQTN